MTKVGIWMMSDTDAEPKNTTTSRATPLAYEALQLTQSQLRKSVKSGEYRKATVTYGYDVAMILLSSIT